MKNEILQAMAAIINTLDKVSVNGRANLENLRNSMVALEQIAMKLDGCEVLEKAEE